MCAECAVSGTKTLSRAASLPYIYMRTVRYSYLTLAQAMLYGNDHSFAAVYTPLSQPLAMSCYTRLGLRTQIFSKVLRYKHNGVFNSKKLVLFDLSHTKGATFRQNMRQNIYNCRTHFIDTLLYLSTVAGMLH